MAWWQRFSAIRPCGGGGGDRHCGRKQVAASPLNGGKLTCLPWVQLSQNPTPSTCSDIITSLPSTFGNWALCKVSLVLGSLMLIRPKGEGGLQNYWHWALQLLRPSLMVLNNALMLLECPWGPSLSCASHREDWLMCIGIPPSLSL